MAMALEYSAIVSGNLIQNQLAMPPFIVYNAQNLCLSEWT